MKGRKITAVLAMTALLVSGYSTPGEVLAGGEAADGFQAETVHYFNDFERAEDLPRATGGSGADGTMESEITVSEADNATTVWRQTGTDATVKILNSVLPTLPEKTDAEGNLLDVALEYRVRLNLYSKEGNFGSVFQLDRNTGINSLYFVGSGTNRNDICTNSTRGTILGKWPVDEWFTVTVLYSGTEDKREIYLNGELLAAVVSSDDTGREENGTYINGWKQMKKFPLTFNFQGNSNTYMEMDYLRIYTPAKNLDFTVLNADRTDTDSLQLQFNTEIRNLTAEQILVDGIPAAKVSVFDKVNHIYTVVPGVKLKPESDHAVSVSGAEDIFGNSLTKDCSFRTREAMLVVSGLGIFSGDEELNAAAAGEFSLKATVRNELTEEQKTAVFAVQYDNDGKMCAELFSRESTLPAETEEQINEAFTGDSTAAVFQTFAWRSEDSPIPVSGFKRYTANGVEQKEYDSLLPVYTGEPEFFAAVKGDYSGLDISLHTAESNAERFVGVLVKDGNGKTAYAATALTTEGSAYFSVPLDESSVGTYSVTAGIQNGGEVSDTVDYYSPRYIARMIGTQINGEDADIESVAEFTASLGGYLKMDTAGLAEVTGKERAYQTLLNIRNTGEDRIFETQEEMVAAFAAAVKMAKIYEGIDAVELISGSDDLGVSDEVLKVFNGSFPASAREYTAEQLKGEEYAIPDELGEAVKTYTILGGVYRADSYKQVRALLEAFGEEIGVDMAAYRNLKAPETVDRAIRGKEYTSLSQLAEVTNRKITEVKKSESSGNTRPSGSSGGRPGGSGIGNMGFPVRPTPTPTPIPSPVPTTEPGKYSFSDVKEDDWFYDDVQWGASKGLFIGTPDGRFMPDTNLTWEHIAIVLGRMGFEVENEHGQADISRGDFAGLLFRFLAEDDTSSPQDWAVEQKVFIGDENGDMMFDMPLTRAECCTVLRRVEK